MAATKQTQAIQVANDLISFAAKLLELNTESKKLAAKYADQGVQAVLNAMATRAFNADGSLGTVDVTVVNTNPINTELYPGLNRAVAANDLIAVKNDLKDFNDFMDNVGSVAAKNRAKNANIITGG